MLLCPRMPLPVLMGVELLLYLCPRMLLPVLIGLEVFLCLDVTLSRNAFTCFNRS